MQNKAIGKLLFHKISLRSTLFHTESILKVCGYYQMATVQEYCTVLNCFPSFNRINKYLEFSIACLRELCIYTPDTEVFGNLLTLAMRDLQLPQDVVDDFCGIYQSCETVTPKELYIYLLKHYLAKRYGLEKL